MSHDGAREDSTTLALDRTILAAERTFASWLRTGLAFLSVGLGAQRFLAGQFPGWELRAVGCGLTLCAVAFFVAAGWRDHRVRRQWPEPGIRLLPQALTGGIAAVLVALALLATAAVWVL